MVWVFFPLSFIFLSVGFGTVCVAIVVQLWAYCNLFTPVISWAHEWWRVGMKFALDWKEMNKHCKDEAPQTFNVIRFTLLLCPLFYFRHLLLSCVGGAPCWWKEVVGSSQLNAFFLLIFFLLVNCTDCKITKLDIFENNKIKKWADPFKLVKTLQYDSRTEQKITWYEKNKCWRMWYIYFSDLFLILGGGSGLDYEQLYKSVCLIFNLRFRWTK